MLEKMRPWPNDELFMLIKNLKPRPQLMWYHLCLPSKLYQIKISQVGDTAFATIELASTDRRASLKEKESSIIDNAIDKKEISVFE